MCAISESDISVPMEISAAAFKTASRSSGRIAANEVADAFVRKPKEKMIPQLNRSGKEEAKRTHDTNSFGVCNVI